MSKVIARSIDDLVRIVGDSNATFPRVITIDGSAQAGKTTLGKSLANELRAKHLDLDDFLERDQGAFVHALHIDPLRDSVASAGDCVVLSGVCMLAVLAKARIASDFKIYLKRVSEGGWADGSELYGDVLDAIATELGRSPQDYKLAFEVREYHRSYRPDECAHAIFERFG